MSIVDKAKRVAGTGGALLTAFDLLVKVEGQPVMDRSKPAKVKFVGIPVFVRVEDGHRYLFGIPLGKRKS